MDEKSALREFVFYDVMDPQMLFTMHRFSSVFHSKLSVVLLSFSPVAFKIHSLYFDTSYGCARSNYCPWYGPGSRIPLFCLP
jgi:hypothetical protein